MKTIKLTIDGRRVAVQPGTSLLQAARSLGIEVPTLCHRDGLEPFTSCMLCVAEERSSGRLIPCCSARAQDGMAIETDNERVRGARRDALELLLSEHVGDCEAPCLRTCPAHMDIPLMIRLIQAGKHAEALVTVKERIALPAVLGRICPAPCEKGCRRAQSDGAVGICLLKRFVADVDLASGDPWQPPCEPESGKTVAIVGAGPAGLAAAFYLRRKGHVPHLFDRRAKPGGMLRDGVPDDRLPREALDAELRAVVGTGVVHHMGVHVGQDLDVEELLAHHDALVLATGNAEEGSIEVEGVEYSKSGVVVKHGSLETTRPGVFAGGDCVRPTRLAIRSVAQGHDIAVAVDQYLRGAPVIGPRVRFDSRIGRLGEEELSRQLAGASAAPPTIPAGGVVTGYSADEATGECGRCLHCDCRKPDACRLRLYADEYGANARDCRDAEREPWEARRDHARVVYEPGKCIRCGLCVRVTRRSANCTGLAFVQRGYTMRVDVPFGESLEKGLGETAAECVQICPTGALAWKEGYE